MAGLPPAPAPRVLPPEPGPEDVQFGACDLHWSPPDRPSSSGTRRKKRRPPEPPLLLAYARGHCFGTCPAYTVRLHSDGALEFEGETCVQSHGHCTATLSKAQLERVTVLLQGEKLSGDVEDFQPITDLSVDSLVVEPPAAAAQATVRWNSYGNRYDQLLDQLDRLLGTRHWIGVLPPTAHRCPD